jgi:hypothetical protein
MPMASIKPKIIGLVLLGGRIQFFLPGTYNALVGKESRLFVNPVFAQLETVLLRFFLAVKDRSSMCLTSTIEPRRAGRKTIPCEYQSNPVAKVGTGEVIIRKPRYRSIPHCLATKGHY